MTQKLPKPLMLKQTTCVQSLARAFSLPAPNDILDCAEEPTARARDILRDTSPTSSTTCSRQGIACPIARHARGLVLRACSLCIRLEFLGKAQYEPSITTKPIPTLIPIVKIGILNYVFTNNNNAELTQETTMRITLEMTNSAGPSSPTYLNSWPCGLRPGKSRFSPTRTVKLVGGSWTKFLEPSPLLTPPSPNHTIGLVRPMNRTSAAQVNIQPNCVYFNQIVYILIELHTYIRIGQIPQ